MPLQNFCHPVLTPISDLNRDNENSIRLIGAFFIPAKSFVVKQGKSLQENFHFFVFWLDVKITSKCCECPCRVDLLRSSSLWWLTGSYSLPCFLFSSYAFPLLSSPSSFSASPSISPSFPMSQPAWCSPYRTWSDPTWCHKSFSSTCPRSISASSTGNKVLFDLDAVSCTCTSRFVHGARH